MNTNKLTTGLRAAIDEGHANASYRVLVRIKDDADPGSVADWFKRPPARHRSLSCTLGIRELADLSNEPWVKAIALSEPLHSLSR